MSRARIQRIRKLSDKKAEAEAIESLPDDIHELTGYEPRPLQAELASNERRFNVQVIHRRFGKSVAKIAKLIERAVECPLPDGRFAYCAPTYAMAEDIAWHYLINMTDAIPGRDDNRGRLSVTIPSRIGSTSRIRLYGLDSPKQRMRGLYLDGCVFDEFAFIPPSAWTEQVRPMLADQNRAGVDRKGRVNQWADFIFTPFGRNHAYTTFRNAQLWMAGEPVTVNDGSVQREVYRHDWSAALYRASETGILSQEELDAARVAMGSSKYLQEFECSFDAAVEGAIFARQLEEAKSQGRITAVPWHKLLPVNTAWDLGWDDATAIWFFQQLGDEVRIIDYYEASGADLAHYADVLAEKAYRYGYHLLPSDVEVHELGSGKSRRTILQQLGIRVTAVPQYSPKKDGIPAAQALLSRCVFDGGRCADGLDRLALYRREYDEKNQVFRENPKHDWASHGASAFMQLAMGIRRNSAGYGAHGPQTVAVF